MLPDNLRLGYPHGLDDQHARLFALCNHLKALSVDKLNPNRVADIGSTSGIQRALRAGDVPRSPIDAETQSACADIIRYTLDHFQWEEVVLERVDAKIEADFPNVYEQFSAHYRKHLSEHASLSQSTLIYKSQFEDHLVSALTLYVFVRHWLVSHVNNVDREFAYWCRIADGLSPEHNAP